MPPSVMLMCRLRQNKEALYGDLRDILNNKQFIDTIIVVSILRILLLELDVRRLVFQKAVTVRGIYCLFCVEVNNVARLISDFLRCKFTRI